MPTGGEVSLDQLIRRLRAEYDGFNRPASDADLARLNQTLGPLQEDALTLYRDHDGSSELPQRREDEEPLPVRLMPITEAIKNQQQLDEYHTGWPPIGRIAWLWTDDNSNYVGIYASGTFEGWLVALDHEEPIFTPAWRSVAGFLKCLLDAGPDACDAVTIPRQMPVSDDDPALIDADRRLCKAVRELHGQATDDDLRRLYAMSAIVLTPVADTATVLDFLNEDDMWTPESAIRLLELRQYRGAVEPVERLARDGFTNGDSAAMRLLVRMRTHESEAALARLKQAFQDDEKKRRRLEQWLYNRDRLQPPRWP